MEHIKQNQSLDDYINSELKKIHDPKVRPDEELEDLPEFRKPVEHKSTAPASSPSDHKKKSRFNLEYLFISLLFIFLSGGYKLGVFNTLFFIFMCYFLLSVSHMLYSLLRKTCRFIYRRFLYKAAEDVGSFVRR